VPTAAEQVDAMLWVWQLPCAAAPLGLLVFFTGDDD
jgi:hypothetical protein